MFASSSGLKDEFSAAAGTPTTESESTWSFINAMRGEMTTVRVLVTIAGSWKQRLFPPPVGMTTTASRF
jgi:hypothetical protein